MTLPKTLSQKTLLEARPFDVREDELSYPEGQTFKRLTVVHPGAVVILPIDNDGEIYLIRQYRHPLQKEIYELPAGTLDSNESPEDCAKREIQEEIKFRAEKWQSLGVLYPAPGFCNEKQYLFLAQDLSPAALDGDEDEIIHIEKRSVSWIEEAILSGEIEDAKTIASIFRARLLGLL